MAKKGKLKAADKAQITKMFKKGFDFDRIMEFAKSKDQKADPTTVHKLIRKHMLAEADTLWSKAVKALSNDSCQFCKSTRNLEAHHLIKRKDYAYRHDTRNGLCLCKSCHSFEEHNPHGLNLIKFDDMLKKYAPQQYDWLQDQQKNISLLQPSNFELREICCDLRKKTYLAKTSGYEEFSIRRLIKQEIDLSPIEPF